MSEDFPSLETTVSLKTTVIESIVHSVSNCFLSSYCVLDTVPGSESQWWIRQKKNSLTKFRLYLRECILLVLQRNGANRVFVFVFVFFKGKKIPGTFTLKQTSHSRLYIPISQPGCSEPRREKPGSGVKCAPLCQPEGVLPPKPRPASPQIFRGLRRKVTCF